MMLAGGLSVGFLWRIRSCSKVFLFRSCGRIWQSIRSRGLPHFWIRDGSKRSGIQCTSGNDCGWFGAVFGRGFGRGTQSHLRFLPEFHTDFIFATLVEELGFVGGSLLIAGYGILYIGIIAPILRGAVTDTRVFIFSLGLFAMLLSQIFINAGMNMGLIPITGITLPFVSYGGSRISVTAVSFGLLWAIAKSHS